MPVPVVCPSNEVLIIFHTDLSDAAKSGFQMVWSPASEAQVRVSEKESLGMVAAARAKRQDLVEKPAVTFHKALPVAARKDLVISRKVVEAKVAAKAKATKKGGSQSTFDRHTKMGEAKKEGELGEHVREAAKETDERGKDVIKSGRGSTAAAAAAAAAARLLKKDPAVSKPIKK